MKMRNTVVAAFAAAYAIAAVAATGEKADIQFNNARAALLIFSSKTNDATRVAAYEYVLERVSSRANEPSTRDAIGYLRTMARALGKDGDGLAVCERLATASTNSMVRVAALSWLMDVTREWDADKATAFVDGWLSKARGDVATTAYLFCRRMELRRKAGDEKGAAEAADAVAKFGRACPWTHYSQACFFRAETLARQGDVDAAEKYVEPILEWDEVASPGMARRLAAARVRPALAERFVEAIRRSISSVPLSDLAAFKARAQCGGPEMVELLVGMGRLEEALGECRVMVLTASSPLAYGNAVRTSANLLKRVDGNLGRASVFLEAQKSNHVATATGTLPAFPALSDPVRRAEREKCLAFAKENASDWNAQLACAYRLLWADCAEESIRAALAGFAVAPFSEKELQLCADAAMHPVSVMTRDPAAVAKVRDYLLYGAAGRDGVAGTGDDLPHPADFYRACAGLGADSGK